MPLCIITFDSDDTLKDPYIGNGERLEVGQHIAQTSNTDAKTGYIDFSSDMPRISANIKLMLKE